MNSDINLVSSKTNQIEKQLKNLKVLQIVAISSLAIVLLISILIFLITVTLPVASVKKEQEQTLSNISSLSEKLVKYSLINDRLSNISDIVKERKDYSKIANSILNKLPADLSVDAMTMDSGTFSLVVSGTSLTEINSFIDDVSVLGDKGDIIKNLLLQSLIANADNGKYILTLQADIL